MGLFRKPSFSSSKKSRAAAESEQPALPAKAERQGGGEGEDMVPQGGEGNEETVRNKSSRRKRLSLLGHRAARPASALIRNFSLSSPSKSSSSRSPTSTTGTTSASVSPSPSSTNVAPLVVDESTLRGKPALVTEPEEISPPTPKQASFAREDEASLPRVNGVYSNHTSSAAALSSTSSLSTIGEYATPSEGPSPSSSLQSLPLPSLQSINQPRTREPPTLGPLPPSDPSDPLFPHPPGQSFTTDLQLVKRALDLFLNSRMREAEQIVLVGSGAIADDDASTPSFGTPGGAEQTDSSSSLPRVQRRSSIPPSPGGTGGPGAWISLGGGHTPTNSEKEKEKEMGRMYFALGYALIQAIKAMMTFEPEDLEHAISLARSAHSLAHALRKPTASWGEGVSRLVKGHGGAGSLKGMTPWERHAELVAAETGLIKSIVSIIYAGDVFAFLKEAINMRNCHAAYRSLASFVEEYQSDSSNLPLDADFLSGVELGNGIMNLTLSLLPGKVLKVMEAFGYGGDRKYALDLLGRAGGWRDDRDGPGVCEEDEGIRRQMSELTLLNFHLVISTFIPAPDVNVPLAAKILHYNLKRYPRGIFFLYFSGRLYATQNLNEKAIEQLELAKANEKEHVQLQHICIWDEALNFMSLNDWPHGEECWATLASESNWSKAIYTYARAACIIDSGVAGREAEVAQAMGQVPTLMKRIGGKSVPMEKYAARKARRFTKQGGQLTLPALEIAYHLHSIGHASPQILWDRTLPRVKEVLAELEKFRRGKEAEWGDGEQFWDDWCTTQFLLGVTLRFLAYPDENAVIEALLPPIEQADAARQAADAFKAVIEYGPQIQLEHWVVYFTHFELGRLHACMGERKAAKHHLELVMSGKHLEVGPSGKKGGKYSMQSAVLVRANAALDGLKNGSK